MTDKERIKAIFKHLNKTAYALSKELGYKRPQVLYAVENELNGISKDLASKIVEKYPEISYGWLLTGSGSMLADENKLDKVIQMEFPDIEEMDSQNKIIDAELGMANEKVEKYKNVSSEQKNNISLLQVLDKMANTNDELVKTNTRLADTIIKLTEKFLNQ